MPDDNERESRSETRADGETPRAADFSEWLQAQPDAVRRAYEGHVSGLKSALDAERDARKALEKLQKEAQQAESDAERQRLAEEGRFQELAQVAEQRAQAAEARLAELEPLAGQLQRYQAALDGYVRQARGAVPGHVQTLLDRLDPVEQLEYLSQNAEAFGYRTPGGPLNSPARGKGAELSDEERRRRAWVPRNL